MNSTKRHLIAFLLPYEVPLIGKRKQKSPQTTRVVPISYSVGYWYWDAPVAIVRSFLGGMREIKMYPSTPICERTLFATNVFRGVDAGMVPDNLADLLETFGRDAYKKEAHREPTNITLEPPSRLSANSSFDTIAIVDPVSFRYAFAFVDDAPHNIQRMPLSARECGDALGMDYVTIGYVTAITNTSATWKDVFLPTIEQHEKAMAGFEVIGEKEIIEAMPLVFLQEK